nr:PREDICTED: uncharacterized protein LOC100875347 isoform X5 [Megachile rotundata]
METEFLNFHDEGHFSDFSLSLEQNLVEKPQDLLMHMVENDFDYMETHLDITNSDGLWNNQHECNDSAGETSICKLDSIKEDFAKVLTDWQEHIGYLQTSDMDEYMDIIGFNINATDKKNFCTSENVLQDELIHSIESDFLVMKEEDFEKESLQSSHSILDVENSDFTESDNKKPEVETESLLKEPKYLKSQNKVKKNAAKYKNVGIDINTTQKKKRKEKQLQYNKDTHNSNGKSEKSRVNQLPVLQAGDVKSLLEQFEASENTLYPSSSANAECDQEVIQAKSKETQQYTKQSPSFTTKKSLSRMSNLHKNIRNALPKEMVEKIKTSAHKKGISIISTIPNAQSNGRSNGTRMQDAAVTLFRNKLLKVVTNDTKSKSINGGLIQLDHDYCSTNSSISSSDNNKYEKQSFSSHLNKNVTKSKECLTENSLKKDSGLESGEVSDNSEEQSMVTVVNGVQSNESTKQLPNKVKDCQKETLPKQGNYQQHSDISTNTSNFVVNKVQSKSANIPKHEMKIQSALATSILQLQQGVLNKTESLTTGNQRVKQMVSVLKRPLNVQQSPVLTTTPNESVVTTTNSLNNEVQNIIVQTNENTFVQENNKKPPRKKLNLAEYRSRREQNRSDNSRTNSPVSPMTLVYIHHASTTTEPIKDDPDNLIWSEREIVSLLKPKAEVDEKKVLPKPPTCDVGIQTYETVFEFPRNSVIAIDEREMPTRDKTPQPCKKQRISSSSSRSRSRSNSKSKSRSRSRSSSNRSRSYKRPRLVRISGEIDGQEGKDDKVKSIIEVMTGIANIRQAAIAIMEIGEGHHQALIEDHMILGTIEKSKDK